MDRSDSSRTPTSPTAFAYQTRLLERTSSITRGNSISKGGGGGTPGILSPSGTRRWTPSHRIGNSIDSVRGKWEDKVKAAESETSQYDEEGGKGGGIMAASSSGGSLVSASSSRSSGLSTTDGDDHPVSRVRTSAARVPRYRLWDEPPPSQSSTSTSVSDRVSPPVTVTAATTPVVHKRHTLPSFFPPPPAEPAYPPPQRSPSPTRNVIPLSSAPPNQSTFSPPAPLRRSYAPLNDTGSAHVAKPGLVKRLSGHGSPFADNADTQRPASAYPATVRSRRPTSVDDIIQPSLTGSSTASSTASSSIPSIATEAMSMQSSRRSPSPASTTTPTSYRSSYMASKRVGGAYPATLGAAGGRRQLGRHLPRIASGDGNEDWEEEKRKEEEREEQEARARIAARERSRQKLEGIRIESPTKALPAVPPLQQPQSPFDPQGTADVQGVPGRLRLSRQTAVPPTPTTKPVSKYTVGLWVDVQRHLLQAYEYLCHVGEAQQWIEGCLQEELPFGVVEMDEGLRNGVVLAKLARVWEGEALVKKIFEHPKLQYKHSDNINYFFVFVRRQGLPESFIFELTDLYEKKNIPKVIYCIHALSHLLARKGLAERIGNLIGQLQFSDDQLRLTQKGLTGVSMPNFRGVGKDLAKDMNVEPEPEPEPEETEYERRGRLLMKAEDSIVQLQARARGYLVRKRVATQRARLRLAERHLIKLQARCRGTLSRQTLQEQRKEQMDLEPWVLALQAAARGILLRRAWQSHLAQMRYAQRYIVKIQAQARGVIERRRWTRVKGALRSSKVSVVKLQALARAKIKRNVHEQVTKSLQIPIVMSSVVGLQAAARGALVRKRIRKQIAEFWDAERSVRDLQAHVRGVIVRRRVRAQLAKLDDATDVVVRIQSACRSWLARQRLLALIPAEPNAQVD